MEAHGKNPTQNVFAIIPARFDSTRLEGKLLLPLAGKPLILHTLDQAKKAASVSRVIVATDDERIRKTVEESGNEVVMTSPDHRSGTDRVAEAAQKLPVGSIIVNVQADEPTISPATIEKAVDSIVSDELIDVSTTSEQISDYRDILDPNVVKVLTDKEGFALYFSRSPIPFLREAAEESGSLENALKANKELLLLFRKHTGLYVYRREFLIRLSKMPRTRLEKTEMLEQLRALEHGARIKVVEVKGKSIGVDTKKDFESVRKLIEGRRDQKYG